MSTYQTPQQTVLGCAHPFHLSPLRPPTLSVTRPHSSPSRIQSLLLARSPLFAPSHPSPFPFRSFRCHSRSSQSSEAGPSYSEPSTPSSTYTPSSTPTPSIPTPSNANKNGNAHTRTHTTNRKLFLGTSGLHHAREGQQVLSPLVDGVGVWACVCVYLYVRMCRSCGLVVSTV